MSTRKTLRLKDVPVEVWWILGAWGLFFAVDTLKTIGGAQAASLNGGV